LGKFGLKPKLRTSFSKVAYLIALGKFGLKPKLRTSFSKVACLIALGKFGLKLKLLLKLLLNFGFRITS